MVGFGVGVGVGWERVEEVLLQGVANEQHGRLLAHAHEQGAQRGGLGEPLVRFRARVRVRVRVRVRARARVSEP